jgi:hypothetical protein
VAWESARGRGVRKPGCVPILFTTTRWSSVAPLEGGLEGGERTFRNVGGIRPFLTAIPAKAGIQGERVSSSRLTATGSSYVKY